MGSLAGELGKVRGDDVKPGTSGAEARSVDGERGGALRPVAIRRVEELPACESEDTLVA